jgi:hypothetical protein
MPFMSASSYLTYGKETTRGTAATLSTFMPITDPEWTPMIKWLEDKGLRGAAADIFSHQVGVYSGEYAFKGGAFLDTLPNMLVACLGGVDVVTGSSAPYTHTIPLLFSIATGSQPPSYTLGDFDAGAAGPTTIRQFLAGQCDGITLNFASDDMQTVSGKFLSETPGTATAPTLTSTSFSSEIFVPGWDCAVEIANVASVLIKSGSIEMNRKVNPVFTLGSQSPYRQWAYPLEVKGKVNAIFDSISDPLAGNVLLAAATTRTPLAVKYIFTEPTSGDTMTLRMSQTQFMTPKITRNESYVSIEAEWSAEANNTDSLTANTFAPVRAIVQNEVSTAY